MRISYLLAVAAALLGGAAQADQQSGNAAIDPASEQMAIGVGIICNTSEQVERYVDLRDRGAESTGAVKAVNDEARDPRACGVAVIAFRPEAKVEDRNAQGKLMSIMRITVVATFDGGTWSSVPGMVQYTIMDNDRY